MKLQPIIDLLQQGKKPLVKITGPLWDDSYGDKGMIARIVSAVEAPDVEDGTYNLVFDYNENAEHNIALDKPTWHMEGGKLGKATDSGYIDRNNMTEEIYFNANEEAPVELVETDSLLAQYVQEKSSLTYVEWLEDQLTKANISIKSLCESN